LVYNYITCTLFIASIHVNVLLSCSHCEVAVCYCYTITGQHTCENCEHEPLVAIVERIKLDNVEVVWMEGGYTKAWRVAKQLDPKNHRKKFDWKDIIPKSSIVLFDFKVTSNIHLRKLTVDHLKKTYLELKQSN